MSKKKWAKSSACASALSVLLLNTSRALADGLCPKNYIQEEGTYTTTLAAVTLLGVIYNCDALEYETRYGDKGFGVYGGASCGDRIKLSEAFGEGYLLRAPTVPLLVTAKDGKEITFSVGDNKGDWFISKPLTSCAPDFSYCTETIRSKAINRSEYADFSIPFVTSKAVKARCSKVSF